MKLLAPARTWWVLTALVFLPATPGAQAPNCTPANNTTCAAAVYLGTVNGDSNSAQITRSGTGGAHFRVTVKETSSAMKAQNARVTLTVPPGIDYDLTVRCGSCTSNVLKSPKGGVGVSEQVAVTKADSWTGGDDTFDLFIEIRYYSGQSCSQWTLTVAGNTAATAGALACP